MRLIIAILLLAGCASPVHEPTYVEATLVPTSYQWSTNESTAGHSIIIEAPADGTCNIFVAATGHSEADTDTLAVIVDDGERMVVQGRGQGSPLEPNARIQAADASTTAAAGRSWADDVNVTRELSVGQELIVRLLAVDLDPADPPFWAESALEGRAAVIDIQCTMSIMVHTQEANNFAIFSEASMSGGAGAHVKVLGQTGVQAANSEKLEVKGEGMLYVDLKGDLLLQHAAAGAIVVETPQGEALLLDHPAALALAIAGQHQFRTFIEGGPGTYSLMATYASVDVTGDLNGFIADWGAPARAQPQPLNG